MIQLNQVRRVSPLRPLQTFSLANKVQGVYRPERNESYMTVNITAKKIQVTQAFSDYATKKIEAKLDRFFSGDADCKVTLSEQKNMITCEVTVRTAGLIFRSEQKATDKTRVEKQLHSSFKGGFDDVVEEQADFEVVKHKKFNLRPMSEEEAILQMNMLEHTFFMFRNAKTGEINVVYKRDDGNYAVLEPSEA